MHAAAEPKLPIGISACLLGQNVRYDGGHKHSRYCTEVLARYFAFQPICPEVEAGFGTPRRAMHLVDTGDDIRLRTTPQANKEPPQDHTAAMERLVDKRLPTVKPLRGFILMQKSPSCGLHRVPLHDENGSVVRRDAAGLFAAALVGQYPLLPVEEAGRLHDDRLCENFIERIYFHDDWCRLVEGGLTPVRLLDFHSRHKFQLLAHDQATYRRLGPGLANLKARELQAIADDYIREATQAMKRLASPGDHVNVMMHVAGYLRDHLDAYEYRMLHEQVVAYQQGDVPLIVPMTLIRNAQGRVGEPWLARQAFLAPYPDRLGLRNKL